MKKSRVVSSIKKISREKFKDFDTREKVYESKNKYNRTKEKRETELEIGQELETINYNHGNKSYD